MRLPPAQVQGQQQAEDDKPSPLQIRLKTPPPHTRAARAARQSSIFARNSQYNLPNARSVSAPTGPPNVASTENQRDLLIDFMYPPAEHSILDDDISVAGLAAPILQPTQRTAAQSSSAFPPPEKKHSSNEAASREFRSTMNQRAPKQRGKPKPNEFAGRLPLPDPVKATPPTLITEVKIVDPRPEFIVMLRGSFKKQISLAQGFRGRVQLRAEFGRVILMGLHPKHVTMPLKYASAE